MTPLQEKITQYTYQATHGALLGYTLLSRPKHAKLPDYPYGYTVRAFRADETTFVYAQIMWDFLPIKKKLVGLKVDDFPWDDQELAWVQGSEDLKFSDPVDVDRIEEIIPHHS